MIANIFQNVGIPNIFNKLLKMFPAYELRSTIYTMEIILTNNKGVFSLEVVWLLVNLNYNGKFVNCGGFVEKEGQMQCTDKRTLGV